MNRRQEETVFVMFVSAQTDDTPLNYLKGAVPEIDGKVVFSETMEKPGISSWQLYDRMYSWAEERATKNNDSIAYASRRDGLVVLLGVDTLVFSQKFYFTDESSISYKISALCVEDRVEVTVEDLYYEYIVSYMNKPETYFAEDIITDKAALKSRGKKLKKKEGKFRKSTIDYVHNIFRSIDEQLGKSMADNAANDPLQKEYHYMNAIPETVRSALSESDVVMLTDSGDRKQTPVVWHGAEEGGSEKTIRFTFDTDETLIKDNYRLAFFRKGSTGNDTPWLIIDCYVRINIDKGAKTEVLAEIAGVWLKR